MPKDPQIASKCDEETHSPQQLPQEQKQPPTLLTKKQTRPNGLFPSVHENPNTPVKRRLGFS